MGSTGWAFTATNDIYFITGRLKKDFFTALLIFCNEDLILNEKKGKQPHETQRPNLNDVEP